MESAMSGSMKRDRFIPFRKADVVEMCINYERVAIYIKFKEAVLAYYFLLTAKDPLTKNQLDDRIENWLAERWDCQIDFEIGEAGNKLQRLNLIQQDGEILKGVPLNEAKQTLDTIWDNFFRYNQTP